jgi:hypothetical protein
LGEQRKVSIKRIGKTLGYDKKMKLFTLHHRILPGLSRVEGSNVEGESRGIYPELPPY